MKKKFLFLPTIIAFFSFSVLAEEGRGRLPDGRAYRTSPDGVQIVDYIAELELSIDGLNRKLQGSEAELEELRVQVGRRTAEAPKVEERDLLKDQTVAIDKDEQRLKEQITKLRSDNQRLKKKLSKFHSDSQRLKKEWRKGRKKLEKREKKLFRLVKKQGRLLNLQGKNFEELKDYCPSRTS